MIPRLLAAAIVVPLVLGWLRLEGERAGLFSSTQGVALMVGMSIVLLTALIWWCITLQRRSEEALRLGEKRTRLIIDSAYDAFIAMNVEGGITDWNPQAEKTFGFSKDEAMGRSLAETIIPERYREAHRLGLKRFLETGEGTVFNKRLEISAVNRSGREFPVELTISPARWGDTWVFHAFVHDITERQERNELVAASAAKDHFIAVLSHELRTPLTPVLATIMDLDAQADIPTHLRDALALIQRNVEIEARLIDDLLDVTRIGKGRLRIDRQVVPVHSVLHNVMEICRSEILKKKVRVAVDLQAPNSSVEGDSPRLLQIFWNLLQNAVKFTPTGGEITVRTFAEGEGRLKVEISDNGIGLEPDMLLRIFEPFEQADSSINRRFGGLGLGLALSKALVEAHGGSIAANSAGVDRGTTFTVELATTQAAPSGAGANGHAKEENPRSARSLRILLVEDHEATRRALQRLLERWGHSVAAAADVTTARELAKAGPFDLLVSDLGLPDAHGTELMRELRKSSSIRGIALSGFGTEDDTALSLEAGFHAHLTKPVGTRQLRALIEEIAALLCDDQPARGEPTAAGDAGAGRIPALDSEAC
ncbi:MAG: hypothetical protein QOE70_2085 [Chthoniobacter sp.]|jgi:PAS domain S-box-containing protein|nr:hypothetical protein [Chthoniobacter sp.]